MQKTLSLVVATHPSAIWRDGLCHIPVTGLLTQAGPHFFSRPCSHVSQMPLDNSFNHFNLLYSFSCSYSKCMTLSLTNSYFFVRLVKFRLYVKIVFVRVKCEEKDIICLAGHNPCNLSLCSKNYNRIESWKWSKKSEENSQTSQSSIIK